MCKTEIERETLIVVRFFLGLDGHTFLSHPQGHYRQIPPREWIRVGEYPEILRI